jgi:pimeloyl-ACP methyl ester carboxylesterase
VKVAVPCISVCSWQWQLEHQGYTQRVRNLQRAFDGVKAALNEAEITPKVVAEAWRRWLPGIPYDYDCQDLLAAFAPRPLLAVNGDSDPVAPLDGVKEAWSVIDNAYRKAGAAENARLFVAENSGHTITTAQSEAILTWFSDHLRG